MEGAKLTGSGPTEIDEQCCWRHIRGVMKIDISDGIAEHKVNVLGCNTKGHSRRARGDQWSESGVVV